MFEFVCWERGGGLRLSLIFGLVLWYSFVCGMRAFGWFGCGGFWGLTGKVFWVIWFCEGLV